MEIFRLGTFWYGLGELLDSKFYIVHYLSKVPISHQNHWLNRLFPQKNEKMYLLWCWRVLLSTFQMKCLPWLFYFYLQGWWETFLFLQWKLSAFILDIINRTFCFYFNIFFNLWEHFFIRNTRILLLLHLFLRIQLQNLRWNADKKEFVTYFSRSFRV